MWAPATSLLGSALTASIIGTAFAADALRPDALLMVDQHREAIIERTLRTWPEALTDAQTDVLRRTLGSLRADRLLTLSLSPGIKSLIAVLDGADRAETARASMGHASKALGDRTSDLTYTPITPCRIVDTRFGGGGILNAGDTRDWLAATPAGNFSAQGGSTTDCPRGPSGSHVPTARS
jgi:hypothetical protein